MVNSFQTVCNTSPPDPGVGATLHSFSEKWIGSSVNYSCPPLFYFDVYHEILIDFIQLDQVSGCLIVGYRSMKQYLC